MMEPKKWVALPFVAFSVAGLLTDLIGTGAVLVVLAYAVLGTAWFVSETEHPIAAVTLLLVGSAAGLLTGMTPFSWWSALLSILVLAGHEVVRWIALPYLLFGGLALGFFLASWVGDLAPGLRPLWIVLFSTAGALAGMAAAWFVMYTDPEPFFERARRLRGDTGGHSADVTARIRSRVARRAS